jgi:hypothetical protein
MTGASWAAAEVEAERTLEKLFGRIGRLRAGRAAGGVGVAAKGTAGGTQAMAFSTVGTKVLEEPSGTALRRQHEDDLLYDQRELSFLSDSPSKLGNSTNAKLTSYR